MVQTASSKTYQRGFAKNFAMAAGASMAIVGNGVAVPAQAQTLPPYHDPAAIDRAVENFTGRPIGAIGGARAAADPRLRLARCMLPLSVIWHGTREKTVKVACEGAARWHIFVSIRPAPRAAPIAAKAPDVIRRGDAVTIAVEGRGFTVRRPGEAQQAGGIGEWINVRAGSGQNARKAKPVSAQIVRPGLVVIPLS